LKRVVRDFKNVVAVHRLREVSCLYGFTRFEAAPTSADGDLEDNQLAVRGAPLAQDADWLPAIEQFGEGIFVHFDEATIREWVERDATRRRHDELMTGYGYWCSRFSGHAPHQAQQLACRNGSLPSKRGCEHRPSLRLTPM
jgi:hypothetical protein